MALMETTDQAAELLRAALGMLPAPIPIEQCADGRTAPCRCVLCGYRRGVVDGRAQVIKLLRELLVGEPVR